MNKGWSLAQKEHESACILPVYALEFANFIGAGTMNTYVVKDKEKTRKDKARQAIALALQSRWLDAVLVNRSILTDFPEDLETYNRLGKALSELGRNREATEAFQRAIGISPHNTIAKKNLDRLSRLGDETPRAGGRGGTPPDAFIEESGKAGVTSLVNLASPEVLLKLAPGHSIQLRLEGNSLRAMEDSGEYVGQVEPRLASRLIRLIKGGNQYEATATSVDGHELTIIIREVYKQPSQAGIVSFPSRGGGVDHRVYLPNTLLGYELGEGETDEKEPAVVKDWSDDDTEPGEDDAFSPVLHRIISAGEQVADGGDEEF